MPYNNNNINTLPAAALAWYPGAVCDTPGLVQISSGTCLVYTGDAALTVTGSVTGRRYRFGYKGDRQLVECPDVNDMLAIRMLQKV